MKEEAAIPHRPMFHIGRCTLAAIMENREASIMLVSLSEFAKRRN